MENARITESAQHQGTLEGVHTTSLCLGVVQL
jgi:hypothetical protein